MPVFTTCPNPACGREYRAADTAAGKRVRCPRCRQAFTVPPSAATTVSRPSTDDDRPLPVAAPASALSSVGRFVVRGKVGEGAFGAVYRAFDPHLDREVALKVPHAAVLDSPKRVERFLREARAAANLRHPHIVPVFDAGSDGGRYYIASAFISGQKLADAIDASDGGLDVDRAARLVRELAEALSYAHEQGVVHRDVKPDNVMLDQHDRVHLMDFGLAVKQDAESRLTRDGAVMGTPAYMAPEQARGDTAAVGPAADQYACGVVLYELLTGKTPFAGPLPTVLHSQIHTDPPPPKGLRRAIPKDVETICLKALRKEPAERYEDCQALADDLRRWQEGEPIAARRQSTLVTLFRWAGRFAAQAAIIAAGAMLVLILLGVLSVGGIVRDAHQARTEKENAVAELQAAKAQAADAVRVADTLSNRSEAAVQEQVNAAVKQTEARVRAEGSVAVKQAQTQAKEETTAAVKRAVAEAEAEVTRLKKSLAVLAEADQLQQSGDVPKARALLAQVDPAHRLRRWHHLKYQTLLPQDPLAGHKQNVCTVAFSPDGKRIHSWGHDKSARLWAADTGAELGSLATPGEGAHSAAINRAGDQLATADADGIKVWSHATGRQVPIPAWGKDRNQEVAFSRDGERFAACGGDGTARVWEAASGKELVKLSGHTGTVRAVAFSPDGKLVVTGGEDKTAVVCDAATGDALVRLIGHTGSVLEVGFSPDGKLVVTGSEDKSAIVWDARNGAKRGTLPNHKGAVSSAWFSPDGKRVVTSSTKDPSQVWDWADEKKLIQPTVTAGGSRSIAFSPDGAKVVTAGADNTAQVWEAATGKKLHTLIGHTGSVWVVEFTPDGGHVVTGSLDKTVKVWDAESGIEVASLTGHKARVTSLAISPDGSTIVSGGEDGTLLVWR